MNQTEREAIKAILDYMWEDESRDYHEQDEEGRENHIFNHLQTLRWTLTRNS